MKKLNEGPVKASNSVTRNAQTGQKTTSRGYEDEVGTVDSTRQKNTKTGQSASVKGIGRKQDGEYSVTSTKDGKKTQRSKFSNRDDYDSALGIEKDIADLTTMEDFEAALNAVVAPILNDDDEYDDEGDLDTTGMDLGNVGSELDADDDEGKGFLAMPMYDQLGKILDSQDNPNPVNTVKTDDGKVIKVSPQQAKALRMLMTTDKVKPQVRTQFQRDLQTSNGLLDFVDIKDYHEIAQLFVKRYLG